MAKTLQELLNPKFIPDILSRIPDLRPVIFPPKLFVTEPTYDIPKHMTDEELLESVVRTSILWCVGNNLDITLCTRGNGKLYLKVTEDN